MGDTNTDKYTNIRLRRETHKKLNEVLFDLQNKEKRRLTFDDVLNLLFDNYLSKKK